MPNPARALNTGGIGPAATYPTTAAGLLRLLGIEHEPVLQQRVALAEWLECNTPTAELQLSLRANGYGLLLPRPDHWQACASEGGGSSQLGARAGGPPTGCPDGHRPGEIVQLSKYSFC